VEKYQPVRVQTVSPRPPLSGARVLQPPIVPVPSELANTRRGQQWQELNDAVASAEHFAQVLGAVLLNVSSEAAYQRLVSVHPPNSFMGHAFQLAHIKQAEDAFFSTKEGQSILRPHARSLARCNRQTLYARLPDMPFVAACKLAGRGHCKYLISNRRQLDRLIEFCHDNRSLNWADYFEIRDYIQTPGDRFTTFRVLVSASGVPLAGGLFYSAHTKTSGLTVTMDRMDDVHGVVRELKQALEDPTSPYYLAALDVRSNLACGGYCVPLMGPGSRRRLSAAERHLLDANGIDPDRPELPPGILEQTKLAGKRLGPRLDVALGLDWVVPAALDRHFLIEVNTDPGAGVYFACGYAAGWLSAVTDMRRHAVATLQAENISTLDRYLAMCPAYDPKKLMWRNIGDGSAVAQLPQGWKLLRCPAGPPIPLSPVLWDALMEMVRSDQLDDLAEDGKGAVVIGLLPTKADHLEAVGLSR
jgi:hypothetical protein